MDDANIIKKLLKLGFENEKRFVELLPLPIDIFTGYEALVIWSRSYYNKFGTLLTPGLLQTLAKKSEFVAYLFHQFQEVMTEPVLDSEFPALLQLLKGAWSRSRLISEVSVAIKSLETKDDPILIAERLTSNLQLALSAAQEEFKRHQIKDEAMQSIEDYKKEKAEPLQLIKFGFPTLDADVGGMKKGDLVLVLGPTGGGKSTLLVNFACNAFKNGHKVLFVSLEIPLRRMRARFHANLLGIDYNRLIWYQVEPEEYEKQTPRLLDYKGEITIIDLPLSTTAAQLSNLIIKEQPDVLIVDYIGLMTSIKGHKMDDWQEQMAIANELKMVARRQEIPIVTAAQFNKAGNERSDLRLTDISRSFGVTNPCAFVFGIRVTGELMALRVLKANDSECPSLSLRVDFSKMLICENAVFQSQDLDVWAEET